METANHINVTLSYNAILKRLNEISKLHTKVLDKWLSEGAFVKFVGDNVDKQCNVRDSRSDHHGELKHMFSLLAIKARISPPAPLPEFSPPALISNSVDCFLPSQQDLKIVESDLQVLVGRILCNHMKSFYPFKRSVVTHIQHPYSNQMAEKSEVIVLDVLHKNETKSSDMVCIMRDMASYLGVSYKHTALAGGDHVTCERGQGAKRHVMCSNTREGRLEQLEPCVEDWHCIMNFMMVSFVYSNTMHAHATSTDKCKN